MGIYTIHVSVSDPDKSFEELHETLGENAENFVKFFFHDRHAVWFADNVSAEENANVMAALHNMGMTCKQGKALAELVVRNGWTFRQLMEKLNE